MKLHSYVSLALLFIYVILTNKSQFKIQDNDNVLLFQFVTRESNSKVIFKMLLFFFTA